MTSTDSDAAANRRRSTTELLVFLLLVLSSIVPTWLAVDIHPRFRVVAIAVVLHDIALVALVLYFVSVQGESVASLGLRARHVVRESVLGVALYVPLSLALWILGELLREVGLTPAHPPPSLQPQLTIPDMGVALVLVAVVAVSEEILFRGYLLLRLRSIVRNTPVAVLLASLVFASGHAYEGVGGVVAVAFLAIVFAVVYLWRGSLVAAIVMHFIQDFLGVLVAPWLQR